MMINGHEMLKKAIEHVCSIFDVAPSALATAEDNRPTKRSYHIVVTSHYCNGDVRHDLVHRDRKKMLALHLDVQVYAQTNQKWKTLYSPKLDDPHSLFRTMISVHILFSVEMILLE